MTDKRRTHAVSSKATIKIEPEVHAYLTLLAEKHGLTLSGAIYKLISEHEPGVIELHNEIEALKQKRMSEK